MEGGTSQRSIKPMKDGGLERLPKSCITLFDFELTSTKHLRKATIEHLRKAYSDLRSEKSNIFVSPYSRIPLSLYILLSSCG